MGWYVRGRAGISEVILAPVQRILTGLEWLAMWIDRALGFPALKRRFRRATGHEPDFDAPRTINEKINWRKLHDRADVYSVIADKVRLQDYLAVSLGAARAEAILPKQRLVTDRPTAKALEALGTGVAIKANHGSGWVRIVPTGAKPDWKQIAAEARMWLRRTYGLRRHEWAYWSIAPKVMVEDLVLGPDGQPAQDVKFAIMDGVCVYIFVMQGRHGIRQFSHYTPDWTLIPLEAEPGPSVPAPAYLEEMRALAEEVGRDFDYIRVDFLCGETEWRLNELTTYSASGLDVFDPVGLDLEFGQQWKHRPYAGLWRG